MPGPMSAPDGKASTTIRRDATRMIRTGKTDLKHGRLKERKEVTDSVRRMKGYFKSRVGREEQEKS